MALLRLTRPATPWTGFQGLAQLREEMDRLFESPFSDFATQRFFNEWAPAVDLYEDKDNLYVKAELPGMKKENIDVSLHEGALTITGERSSEKQEGSTAHRTERFVGRFQRTVMLPTAVDAEKVQAAYQNGILSITLPKAEAAKPKQIEVKVK